MVQTFFSHTTALGSFWLQAEFSTHPPPAVWWSIIYSTFSFWNSQAEIADKVQIQHFLPLHLQAASSSSPARSLFWFCFLYSLAMFSCSHNRGAIGPLQRYPLFFFIFLTFTLQITCPNTQCWDAYAQILFPVFMQYATFIHAATYTLT